MRCCAKGLGHDDACENCKVGEIQDRREYIEFAAANRIECLTAENAELRKEIEWKDMVISLAKREQAKALDAADLIDRLTDENAALREKNWGCRQQMSEKLYGAYLTSVQNVMEAKLELAKQAAQGVERAMLDDDMFLVKGDTVGWKVRIYRNVADNYVDLP